MKRALRQWSGALLALLLLAGCAGKEVPQPQTEERITLRWLVVGERYRESDRVFRAFNRELRKRFPDLAVEFEVVQPEDYRDRWDMMMATNTPVDLAWIGNETISFAGEVDKGSFMALDYLLSELGGHLRESISPELWEGLVYQGNTYGIPVEGARYRSGCAVVADAYLMGRYGDAEEIGKKNRSVRYTDRSCFAAFEPFLEGVYQAGDIGAGVSYETFRNLADKGYEGVCGADSPFVIRIFDEQPVVYNKYAQESYRAYFETMADWYAKGYIRADVEEILDPREADGKAGGSILFLDVPEERSQSFSAVETEYEAVREDLVGYDYIPAQGCSGALVVPKSAENPDRAVELLNYLYSDQGLELYHLLADGLEREHYLVLSDGTMVRRRDNADRLLYRLPPCNTGNELRNYPLSSGEWERVQTRNQEALRSPLTGFVPDTRMIAAELLRVNLVAEEYLDRLSRGTAEDWETLYAEFLERMEAAGADKVQKDLQRQLDEFWQSREGK